MIAVVLTSSASMFGSAAMLLLEGMLSWHPCALLDMCVR